MQIAHRCIASLFLTAVLVTPAITMAAPTPQEASVQVRVYDANHKDYHNWDAHEEHAWGQFEVETHRNHHDYQHANKKEQSQYWNWRHSHPD